MDIQNSVPEPKAPEPKGSSSESSVVFTSDESLNQYSFDQPNAIQHPDSSNADIGPSTGDPEPEPEPFAINSAEEPPTSEVVEVKPDVAPEQVKPTPKPPLTTPAKAQTSGSKVKVKLPEDALAESQIMPATWDGPTGTSKSRTLVKAMNNAKKLGLVNDLAELEMTQDDLAKWKEAGFDTPEAAARWARFGLAVDRAVAWKNIGVNDHDAFNFTRLGATPDLIQIVRENHPSNNAPSDSLVADYVQSYKDFSAAIAFPTPEKVLYMTKTWWDWSSDKAIALDEAGYTHEEADQAYDAGQGETVELIKKFVDAQRSKA